MKLSSGNSENDRISFFVNDYGKTAVLENSGNIVILHEKENRTFAISHMIIIIFTYLISVLKEITIRFLIKNPIISEICYLLPVLIEIIIVIIGVINLRKQGKELLKNHAAEHMVFAAYQKKKKVPTIDEARKFCRLSGTCGVSIFSGIIMSQIIGFLVYHFTGFIIPEILLLALAIFAKKFFPLSLVSYISQLFTTSKPEKRNLELAIAALSALENEEKRFC